MLENRQKAAGEYLYNTPPTTKFTERASNFFSNPINSDYLILVGRNNSGKSFILKKLAIELGDSAFYFGPSRYQNFNQFGNTNLDDRTTTGQRYTRARKQWDDKLKNVDSSAANLQQEVTNLSTKKRKVFCDIISHIFGSDIKIKYTDPNNNFSPRYLAVDGHNISYTSSGFRLVATLIIILLDERIKTFLIDEPELGISPETQAQLAEFLFDKKIRKKYFSHVEAIVFATHSTVFLDRGNIGNNYFIERVGNEIDIQQVKSISDFHKIHFFLLGNRLETLFLPSSIVIVEGVCDYKFIKKAFDLRFDQAHISILQANGDSRIKEIFHISKAIFGDIQKSPYKERIFVVLDKIHGIERKQQLISMGLPEENIIVWDKNGIEYYYPDDVLDKIFHTQNAKENISMTNDIISLGDTSYTKSKLVDLVTSKMDAKVKFCDEFEDKLLNKVNIVSG